MDLTILPTCLINGEEQDLISVQDRGFQYGDGLFETLRIEDGKPRHWQRHARRMQKACERLALRFSDVHLLEAEIQSLCRGVNAGVLKIILTRGVGKRGYVPPDNVEVTRVLSITSMPQYPATHKTDGVALTVCQTPLGINPVLAGIKHLNRLEQVLARAEWDDPEISEGLMLDIDSNVIEGTMSNVFCVRKGELLTPDLSRCGVEGITRERVMKAATDLAYKVEVKPLSLDDVKQCDELFMCNSLIGIWPVKQLGEQTWTPGPVTGELIQALEKQGG